MTKHKAYMDAMMRYGWYSLLYLIDKLESDENYEEAAIAHKAFCDFKIKYNLDVPIRYDDPKTIDAINKAFAIWDLTPKDTLINLDVYSSLINDFVVKNTIDCSIMK